MRIISIHVYKLGGEEPVMLANAYEVSFVSIFQRGTLKEFINFNSRLVIGYEKFILKIIQIFQKLFLKYLDVLLLKKDSKLL
jgi:hypothetical protein